MRLSEIIPLLFDVRVSFCVATPQMYGAALLREETAALMGAAAKRRREYAAGRAAARQAVRKLGISPGPIVTQHDRTPKWPDEVVGSISHCPGCCVAVAASSADALGVGIDVENATPLPTELSHMICRESEESLEMLGPLSGKLVFCAKEAFYKCYYPITKQLLDFSDVSVRFSANRDHDIGVFSAVIANPNRPRLPGGSCVTGRWFVASEHILVGVTCALETLPRNFNPNG